MKFFESTRRLAAGAVALSLAAVSFAAPAGAFVNEIRGGVYAHDQFGPAHEPDNADINGEILFDSPDFLSWMFSPRPRFGGTMSGNGGTSIVYLDLGWTIDLGTKFFLDGSVGGAWHDGRLRGSTNGENQYGCRLNFHESGSIGYRVTPALSIMASIEHISNASLCSVNDGLTNIGMRIGYSF